MGMWKPRGEDMISEDEQDVLLESKPVAWCYVEQ